jgi:hypothetical protein
VGVAFTVEFVIPGDEFTGVFSTMVTHPAVSIIPIVITMA